VHEVFTVVVLFIQSCANEFTKCVVSVVMQCIAIFWCVFGNVFVAASIVSPMHEVLWDVLERPKNMFCDVT